MPFEEVPLLDRIPGNEAEITPDPATAQDDTPSMRAVVFLKEPTEAMELDILNLEGVIIAMRVDGSAILYIPWSRVKHVEVPKSLNQAAE
jgi:hypothetical protein